MKILFVGIDFGNYELKIKRELECQGHDVTYMYDSPRNYSIIKRLFGSRAAKGANQRYQDRCLSSMKHGFDQVIVIVGRALTVSFLEQVRAGSPQAVFSLYLWDDVKRVENFEDVKNFYDRIFSFDLRDCQKYGFLHMPLFFTKRLSKKDEGLAKNKYDIYSAMFNHSDRERIIRNVNKQILQSGKKSKFFICLGRFEYYTKRRKYRDEKGIQYISKTITEDENYQYMKETNAILDIQFASQTGLTMRTLESLGMDNKLITTNKSIQYYDFYDKVNILIIDRENPVFDTGFLDAPKKRQPEEMLDKYSLKHWVETITGVTEIANYIGGYKIDELRF